MNNSEDRRKFPRFNLLVNVSVAKHASNEKSKVFTSKNISQGGVCIIALDKPVLGDLMDLKIRLPKTTEDIMAIGKVVWVKEFALGVTLKSHRFEVGLEFVGLNDNVFEKIKKYFYSKEKEI